MTKRLSIASALLAAFSALLAMLLVATPALAHHNGDHDKGKGQQTQSKDNDGDADNTPGQTTEDNDAASADQDGKQTPNNVEDDGDNRHPSGKDRSVENGGSGNQGNSESTPDQNGKGPERDYNGTDKPGGSGGVDKNDQDGNNGCGNDDDFEDDNEGWCGKPPKNDEVPCDADADMEGVQPCDVEEEPDVEEPDVEVEGAVEADLSDDVLGLRVDKEATRPARDEVAAGTAAQGSNETRGGLLPFTGAEGLVPLLAIAALLVVTGIFLSKAHR